MAKKVAVLMGGWSSERQISLVSGGACAAAAIKAGYAVTTVDVTRDIVAQLREAGPDVVLNALHGPWGEDGRVQAVLEWLGLAYTHSGVLASALAMDKARAKAVFRDAGLPVAEHRLVDRRICAESHVLAPPYVIKPVYEGSSVGVFIVREHDNRPPQRLIEPDWAYGDEVMVEAFVPGREFTVAVLGDRALGVTEILTGREFYDFDAKYAAGGSRHILPAPIPDELALRARDYALRAHRALGCRGVTRSDFRYDPDSDRLIILETNTQPGMTPTSLAPEQAALCGMDFAALTAWMIEDASCPR